MAPPYNGAPGSNVQEQILSVRPLCVTDPSQMPGPAKERWPQLNDVWQTYFKESLTGTKYRDEAQIPPTDGIFRTKGLGRQLPVEPITLSKKVLLDPDLREDLLERGLRELREERELREAQQRAREERELREAQQRAREAREARERAREAREAREREREARQREREAREAAQNKPSTPSNVCPNCLNPFRQGEVFCQTARCMTVLQTKTKLCRGCGKPIPSTVAFCRHCGLRQ